jgi:hypothetical protein
MSKFELYKHNDELFNIIWFSGFRGEDLNVIFYQNMPNLHNLYNSAERKISHTNPKLPTLQFWSKSYYPFWSYFPFFIKSSSTFHILIFSSETTGPIATKLWGNGPWMAPFQNCVDLLQNCRVGRSWHAAHFCNLNLTFISYSVWYIRRKVLKF